jgi:hypothetical protein
MWPYKKPIQSGVPWFDFKEGIKSLPEIVFVFKIENYLSFILRELCITFPAVAVSGNTQLPIKATVQVSSTQNLLTPREIPPELFSSPSQNFNLSALNEDAQGMRLAPFIFNYPCEKGETITVIVSGAPLAINVGCMIAGRKFGGRQ